MNIEDNVDWSQFMDLNVTKTEQCMVLIGERTLTGIRLDEGIVVPNRHTSPLHHFRVYIGDVPERYRDRIVGVAHTHPGTMASGPSYNDIVGVRMRDLLGVVYHVPTRRITYYSSRGYLSHRQYGE